MKYNQTNHGLKWIFFLFIPILVYNCSPNYHLKNPEAAWMSESLPQIEEYVMIEYHVKLVKCDLKKLLQGESGFRWKVIVKFKDNTEKHFWAYKLSDRNMTTVALYAPISMGMKELMAKQAKVFLVSHDQRKLYAYAYTTSGHEHPKKADEDEFDWAKADIIAPGENIKIVKRNSKSDWVHREKVYNQVAHELATMNPMRRLKVAKYMQAKKQGRVYLGVSKALEVISQYFAGYVYSGDWLNPLYSLSIFQGVWLINLLMKPDNPQSPEYYGAYMTNRRFSEVMTAFHDSLMLYVLQIQKKQQQLEEELTDELLELKTELARQKIIAEQALKLAEFNNHLLQKLQNNKRRKK